MKKRILKNQRGLFYRHGDFVKSLGSGKHSYSILLGSSIEVVSAEGIFAPARQLNLYLEDERLKQELDVVEVQDHEIIIHKVDGLFNQVLRAGKYAFWNILAKNEFTRVDLRDAGLPAGVSLELYLETPAIQALLATAHVKEHEIGLHYIDSQFNGFLRRGKHGFWNVLVKNEFIIGDLKKPIIGNYLPLETYLEDESLKGELDLLEVQDHEMVLHYTDDNFQAVRGSGRYLFWNKLYKNKFVHVDLSSPYVAQDLPLDVYGGTALFPCIRNHRLRKRPIVH